VLTADSWTATEGAQGLLARCTHSRWLVNVDCSNFYFVFSNTRRLLCIPLSAQLGIIRHVEVT
jgi:hypothetical protein